MKRCLKQTYGVRGGIRQGKHLFHQRMFFQTMQR